MARKVATARETLNNRNRNSQKLLAASTPVLDLADITQKVLSSEIKLNGCTYTVHYLPLSAESALLFYENGVIASDDLLFRFVWLTSHGWCDESGNLKFTPITTKEDYDKRKSEFLTRTSFQFWNLLAGLILEVSGFKLAIKTTVADESADSATEENPTMQEPKPITRRKNTANTGEGSVT